MIVLESYKGWMREMTKRVKKRIFSKAMHEKKLCSNKPCRHSESDTQKVDSFTVLGKVFYSDESLPRWEKITT